MIMACLLEVPQMLFKSTLYTVNEELYRRKLGYVYGTVTIIISSLVRIWLMSSTEWYFAPSHVIIIFAKYSSYFRIKSSIRSWRNITNMVPLVFPFLTTTLSRLVLEMAASTLYFFCWSFLEHKGRVFFLNPCHIWNCPSVYVELVNLNNF